MDIFGSKLNLRLSVVILLLLVPPVFSADEINGGPANGCKGLDAESCFILVRRAIEVISYKSTRDWATVFVDACKKGDAVACVWADDSGQWYKIAKSPLVSQPILKKLKESCQQREPSSCLAAGVALRNSVSRGAVPVSLSPKDKQSIKETIEYYEKACGLGVGKGCFSMGSMYERGVGVEESFAQAGSYFLKACDLGDAEGCANAGFYFSEGRLGEKSPSKARELWAKACKIGHGTGCIDLGEDYLFGENKNAPNALEKAKGFYLEACFFSFDTYYRNLGCSRLELIKLQQKQK